MLIYALIAFIFLGILKSADYLIHKCNQTSPGKWTRFDIFKVIIISLFSWIGYLICFILFAKTNKQWWNKETEHTFDKI